MPASRTLRIRIEGAEHCDPREHPPAAAALGGIDQVFDRDLPAFLMLHVFGQFHDVVGGVLQRHELATAAQDDRLVERR